VDVSRGTVRTIGRLPVEISHAAGAVLGGTFYVLGGRGDALDSQTRAILAVDPATGAVHRAGRLPSPTSDAAAVTSGRRVLLVGGRDERAGVLDRIVSVEPVP
jgi:N-acetylneuraminic acid mutarotase